MAEKIDCNQEQCMFLKIRKGCPVCEKCKCEPFKIDVSCDRCFRCENIPDCLRAGDNDKKIAYEQAEVIECELKR